MVMTSPDETAAVRAYLLAQAEIVALVGQRVYVWELPEDEADNMPRACIVVNDTGLSSQGQLNRSRVRFQVRTKDLKCYGASSVQARAVWDACSEALARMRPHTRAGVRLYGAVVGGPQGMREPAVNWPMWYTTFNLSAATVAA